MELRHKKVLVVFTVRRYSGSDVEQIIKVYQSAFAEPPWNEYMKCVSCGIEYGRKEVERARKEADCKKCNQLLELTEFWAESDILEDLRFALAQPDSTILVAENSDGLAGFTWGYRIPLDKFPFLKGKVPVKSSYMDEVAVRGDKRLRGVGTLLGEGYVTFAKQQGLSEIVLRTDERNVASMALFRKLGFLDIPDLESSRGSVYDPEFPNRIYLRRGL